MPFADIERKRAYNRKKQAEYRERNPEKALKAYELFKERRKSYTPEQMKEKRHRLRVRNKVRAFLILGSKCARCGETDFRLLSIHHKNGDGAEDRRSGTNPGTPLYSQIRRFERDDLELLCRNCQTLFEWERSGKWFPEGYKRKLKKELIEHKIQQNWFGEIPD